MIIKRVLWLLTGTQAGCDQWVGGLPPERLGRAYVFLNKSSRAQAYINKCASSLNHADFAGLIAAARA